MKTLKNKTKKHNDGFIIPSNPYKSLARTKKGKIDLVDIIDTRTGEVIKPKYLDFRCPQDYINSGIVPIEPMTAKEYLNDEELNTMLNSPEYIAEEKLDGTRCLLYTSTKGGRAFSRRISKDTNFYSENSDLLPHLRDFDYYNEEMTVLDGELFIPKAQFKEVSSTLNCLWDKAIQRQIEYGLVILNAFDIIYYNGIYVGNMPLSRRKVYLHRYLEKIKCPYIREVPFTINNTTIDLSPILDKYGKNLDELQVKYPSLYKIFKHNTETLIVEVDKQTYFEYIVARGGEGIMLKPLNGRYYQKRGREYTKYKKHISRECVILYFKEPTKIYDGDHIEDWEYWCHEPSNDMIKGKFYTKFRKDIEIGEVVPVTKHFFNKWAGKMVCGVLATEDDIKKYEKDNKCKAPIFRTPQGETYIEVVECEGYNEDLRKDMTEHPLNYIGETVEIEANEIFKKTGKLRHPRYLRMRFDKEANRCTWADHVGC